MTLVEDVRTDGFTFTWTIHNFSYCVQKEREYLDSPSFEEELHGMPKKWFLRLYPRGDGASGFISYYLLKEQIDRQNYAYNFTLSIRAANGKFKELGKRPYVVSLTNGGYKFFLSLYELNKPYSYLDNDTLTLRCRIWSGANPGPTSVNCYGHTYIKVSKIDYVWTLKEILDNNDKKIIETKFNLPKDIRSTSPFIPSFKIKLLYGGTFGDDTVHFAMERPASEAKQYLFICTIHLLDADGRISHSARGEYLFLKSVEPQTWTFPLISTRKLLSNEKLYLPNGNLTLRCEFSAASGDVSSDIERIEYGNTDDPQFKASIENQVPNSHELWKESMQRFYHEGKFSDVTVRTPTRQFPVHKAILCAHSEVFGKMFERDMKENLTGVVDIEDLEDDTVSKVLMFLYTNSIEDIDSSMACKLYFAADKYQIASLRSKCSKHLMRSLDASNVCRVLDLADTHQDQVLKSIAQNFISDQNQEIVNSDDWKKLMDDKPYLTSETMQLMICKKLYVNLNI